MASNTTKLKFHRNLIVRPAECTQNYNLAHYEKRLDSLVYTFAAIRV